MKTQNTDFLTDPLLSTKEAAAAIGMTARYLESRRLKGGGPTYVKMGTKTVRYRLSDLKTFVVENLRRHSTDTGGQSDE